MRFAEKTVVVIGATGGLGTAIVSPDKVAGELVKAVDRREKVHIMGGWTTRLFTALNAVSPRLADALLMKRYAATMGRFFARPDDEESNMPPARPRSKWGRTLGILLIVLSFLAYGVLLGLPFLPLEGRAKLALAPVLVGVGEATFWIGGLFVGKELITRYRRYLNPCVVEDLSDAPCAQPDKLDEGIAVPDILHQAHVSFDVGLDKRT